MLLFHKVFVYFCDIQYHRPKFFKKYISTYVLFLGQSLRILLPKPTMVCLLFAFWLLGLSITGFVIKIVFTLILELISITFIICFFILKFL